MYFQFGPEVSYKVQTTSGVVNDSGKPQALYGIAINSATSVGTAAFFDGTSSLGTWVFDQPGTANSTALSIFGMGLVFPNGLFVSFDTATAKVTTWTRQVIT